MREILRSPLFLAESVSHFCVDTLNSAFPVILVALAVSLGLSNTQLGLASTLYILGTAVGQPLFGWVTDRWGSRGMAVGGVLWMAVLFGAGALLPVRVGLPLLLAAGIGSSAFHPQATMHARQSAGQRPATGTSIFFLFGQVGLALGPALAGLSLAWWGVEPTLLLLAATMVPLAPWLWVQVPASRRTPPITPRVAAPRTPLPGWGVLALFAILLACRSWPQAATGTFLPKFFAERGLRPDEYGLLLTLFMLGSGLGGVAGGWLADHWRRRGTVVVTLALGAVPLWLIPQAPLGSLALPLLIAVAGALNGASHSIVVLLAQAMLPGRMALASGLVLGFMFSAGALGTSLTGVAADRWGVALALALLAPISLLAALAGMALPRPPAELVPSAPTAQAV